MSRSSIKQQIAAARQSAAGKAKPMWASALHILVRDEAKALDVLAQLRAGADFARLARMHSTCPSGKKGGDLGEFRRGDMVPAFDQAVFNGPLEGLRGPIKTRFGYHIIKVLYRR